jgi:hypothetical protein
MVAVTARHLQASSTHGLARITAYAVMSAT